MVKLSADGAMITPELLVEVSPSMHSRKTCSIYWPAWCHMTSSTMYHNGPKADTVCKLAFSPTEWNLRDKRYKRLRLGGSSMIPHHIGLTTEGSKTPY